MPSSSLHCIAYRLQVFWIILFLRTVSPFRAGWPSFSMVVRRGSGISPSSMSTPTRRSARSLVLRQQQSPAPDAPVPPPAAAVDESTFSSPPVSLHKRRKVHRSPVSVTPDGSRSSPSAILLDTPLLGQFDAAGKTDIGAYIDLQVSPRELRPSATLTTGQCFHWKALSVGAIETDDTNEDGPTRAAGTTASAWGTHDATEWIGTLRSNGRSVVVRLKETTESTLYQVLHPPPSCDHRNDDVDVPALLRSYFQLAVPLEPLYGQWSEACPRLARIAKCIPGVRVVDQDPWECLVSFICSSNNNIPRITKMLEAIRAEYGDPILTFQGRTLHSFPSLDTMKRRANESDLRDKCGLGYRAKYLVETIQILDSVGGEEYLRGLRSVQNPRHVQSELTKLRGVGRKVADCVALFSLQQTNAIPVDVHVWQIARRDYNSNDDNGTDRRLPENVKSLTPKVYEQVGDLFRTRFGSHGGWAHSLLFVAELPSFRPALPADMVEEMDRVRTVEVCNYFLKITWAF
jgi:N-glycosylase/DNA lyase